MSVIIKQGLARQLRTIASRGRMDDTDVQIIFDAADEIEMLHQRLYVAEQLKS